MMWVTSTDLRNWADRRDCQETLPQLVRKLIRATTMSVRHLRFPAGENVQIGGWDGILEMGESTEYLPMGTSLWEFGTDKDPKGKADSDYNKRTANPLGYDPATSTFVFVTPRLWKKGEEWAAEKNNEGIWRDIRVINSEGLEEWLEVAPSVACWLAVQHLSKYPATDIQSTEDFWADWSTGPTISLKPSILLGGRNQQIDQMKAALSKAAITTVRGLSREEAVAFLIATYKDDPLRAEDFFARSIIVDTPEAFKQLAVLRTPLILIARFEDTGIFNRAVSQGHHVFVPLGADSSENWREFIALPRLDRDAFVQSLTDCGISAGLAENYSKESLRNITVLRRRLGFVNNTPAWASAENVQDIIPALLVGKWMDTVEKDREVVASFARMPYEEYAKRLTRWLFSPDSPIVRVGDAWRIASPLDAWTNASKYLANTDVDVLRQGFLEVLGEIDPAFDVEPQQRHMASLLGKQRAYSNSLREGLCQSLLLVGLFGNQLRLPGDAWVAQTVSSLLSTPSVALWKSFERHLPLLAEAAPTEFVYQVEKLLIAEDSPVLALFQEDPGFMFPQSYHTGLLWALEAIAWLPDHLSRASLLLAKLAAIDPGGSIQNRPINSLTALFKPWYPQTVAPLNERIAVLRLIARTENEVAWTLLLRLLPKSGGDSSMSTNKLKWRNFEEAGPLPVTYEDLEKTHTEVVHMLLDLFDDSEAKLGQLIQVSTHLHPSDRNWILSFLETGIDQVVVGEESTVWNSIRSLLSHHRTYPDTDWSIPEPTLLRYEHLMNKLEPTDEILKDQWLFDEPWPHLIEGSQTRSLSLEERFDRITLQRVACFERIYKIQGLVGVNEVASRVKNPAIFGETAARVITDEQSLHDLFERLLNKSEGSQFLQGFFYRRSLLDGIKSTLNLYQLLAQEHSGICLIHLLTALPQSTETWDFIDRLEAAQQNRYWSTLTPCFGSLTSEEQERGLHYLLTHKRYVTAIIECTYYVDKLATATLIEILMKAATESADEAVQLQGYEIQQFFAVLDTRSEVERGMIIQLEWLYLSLLESYGHSRGAVLLHQELARDPNTFMEVFKMIYKPGERAIETQPADLSENNLAFQAKNAYRLLESWKQIPGLLANGEMDGGQLTGWVSQVRTLAQAYDRVEAVDNYIGKILAQFPEAEFPWPPESICAVVEAIATPSLQLGFSAAVFNKRGFSTRGPYDGGIRERNLEDYFRGLAQHHRNQFPVIAVIFEGLADGYKRQAGREDVEAELNSLDY